MKPNTYYVLRYNYGALIDMGIGPEVQSSEVSSGFSSHEAATVKTATKFSTVGVALATLQNFGRSSRWHQVTIARVEETTSAPSRELVTSGDLSLLDGPCVIQSPNTKHFLGTLEMFSWKKELQEARVFANQTEAIEFQVKRRMNNGGSGATEVRVVPIREIPGTVEVKETVLA